MMKPSFSQTKRARFYSTVYNIHIAMQRAKSSHLPKSLNMFDAHVENPTHIDNNPQDNTIAPRNNPLSHYQLPHMSSKLPYQHPVASKELFSPPTTDSHPFSQADPHHFTQKKDRKHFHYEYTRSMLHSSIPGTHPKYLSPHNMNYNWATYEEAMKRKNDPDRSPGDTWRITTYKTYSSQRKHDIVNFSNSNVSVVDALKYGNSVAFLKMKGGEGDGRIRIFRSMEAAAERGEVEEAFRLYGEFHGQYPHEPRSTYMGNMLLRLCKGQHPSRVRYLMTEHFCWDVHNQEEEHFLAPQNLETFRLALAAFSSTGFYQELNKYFQFTWRYFGQDLVAYHIILRNTMTAPKGLFMKWFKQLFQTNLGNNGSRNPRKIQPSLEAWKMLMLYHGSTGSRRHVLNIFNHIKAFNLFEGKWKKIEKELVYAYNTAILRSQSLTPLKKKRHDALLSNYYNTVDSSLPRVPEGLSNTVLYPAYSLPLDQLYRDKPHEDNDLTKLKADKNMVFDTRLYQMVRKGFGNPYESIKYYKRHIRFTDNPEEHHHTTIYANKILRSLFRRDPRLGFKFLLENYELKNHSQVKMAIKKIQEDSKWLSRFPRTSKMEARMRKVNRYWAVRKKKVQHLLAKNNKVLSLLPPVKYRKKLEQRGLSFAKVQPNEGTFAQVLYQAYRVHRNFSNYKTEETRQIIQQEQRKIAKQAAEEEDPAKLAALSDEWEAVSHPVAMEGSPIAWALLDELNVASVEGGQHTTLGGYFKKLYGTRPIRGAWFDKCSIAKVSSLMQKSA